MGVYCRAMVFRKFRYHCPHETRKRFPVAVFARSVWRKAIPQKKLRSRTKMDMFRHALMFPVNE